MNLVETIKVQFKSGKFSEGNNAKRWFTINASDFDPSLHSKEEIKEAPKVEEKATRGRPKKGNNIESYSPSLSSKK